MSIFHRYFYGLSSCFLVIVLCWEVVAAFGSENRWAGLVVVGLAQIEGTPAGGEVLKSLHRALAWNGHGQGRALLGNGMQLIAVRSVIQSSGTTYDFQLLNNDIVCIRKGTINVPEFDVPFCVVLCVEGGGVQPSLSSNSLWAVGMKVPRREPDIVYDVINHRYHVGRVDYMAPYERMHIMPIIWSTSIKDEDALRGRLFHDLQHFRLVWNGYFELVPEGREQRHPLEADVKDD